MTKRLRVSAWVATCAFLHLVGCARSAAPPTPPSRLELRRPPWSDQPLLFGPTLREHEGLAVAPPDWLARGLGMGDVNERVTPPSVAAEVAASAPIEPSEIAALASAPAPLGLTSADGAGLRLVALEAHAVVAAPLAFTELHLTFANPEPRVLQGRFRIALPSGAALSRFAMAIDSRWQEGEVLEQQHARRTFEDFLHRRQDPALLEQAAGNEFAARVFPIPAGGEKQLVVAYSEELDAGAPYRLRLAGLPQMERFDATVHLPGRVAATRLTRKNYLPRGDLVVPRSKLGAHSGLRSGRHVILQVSPAVPDEPEPLDRVAVLVDTSASRALGFDAQLAVLERLVGDLRGHGGGHLLVGCFDQHTQIVHEGEPATFGDAALDQIRARGALGASDLHGALRWVAPRLGQQRIGRLVLLTDAIATVGGSRQEPLPRTIGELRAAGVERVDVVAFGGIRDEGTARQLVRSLPHQGMVIDGGAPGDEIFERLSRRAYSKLAVQVENAREVWPREVDGVQFGDQVLVYTDVPLDVPPRLTIGGRAVALGQLREADERLVGRSWARARIEALLDRERRQGRSPKLRDQIVALSTRHRVLSPYTAFLVLETSADYERFGIRRDALADILTVSRGALTVVQRTPASSDAPPDRDRKDTLAEPQTTEIGSGLERRSVPSDRVGATPAWDGKGVAGVAEPSSGSSLAVEDEARGQVLSDEPGAPFGAGSLSLRGTGEGGGGVAALAGETPDPGHALAGGTDTDGAASLPRAHRVRPPLIRMGATTVTGRLPPETVQHIVRLNHGRIRACYHRGLLRNPQLHVRVLSRFVIGRDGVVANVDISAPDLQDTEVERCVADAFYQMRFPHPEGGIVTVEYPVVLHLDGQPSALPPRAPVPDPPAEPEQETEPQPEPARPEPEPWTGRFAEVMAAIALEAVDEALLVAQAWHEEEPGDLLALVALGRALAANGELERAERAFGSIIDLYSFRADLRRFAGAELESLEREPALVLAIDSYRHAAAQRPDHASGHRLLGMALLRQGQYQEAFDALLVGRSRTYPEGRFAEVRRVLGEDLALVAAAWSRSDPSQTSRLRRRLAMLQIAAEDRPSLRFVLSWETDANDVDLHVYDGADGHAYYSSPQLPNDGGSLYADVTNGYGPEIFTVRRPRSARAEEYRLVAHYFRRGPMGYGLGKLQVVEHDGAGRLTFQERPFVVMNDDASVDLGHVQRQY